MNSVRMGQVLLVSAVALGIAAPFAFRGATSPAQARIVFMAQGDAAQDSYFQRFATALKARHPELLAHTKVEALSLPRDEAGLEQALRQAGTTPPTVWVAQNGAQARAARKVGAIVPLVFSSHADPRLIGIASNLLKRSEPSTGLWINDDLDAKRLDLLLDAYPSLTAVAILGDSEWFEVSTPQHQQLTEMARARGVALHILQAASVEEALTLLDAPESTATQAWCLPRTTLTLDGRVGKRLGVMGKPVMAGHTPDVYETANLSYAFDKAFVAPALADLAARVVSGDPPGSIPIQTPERFQLAVRITADPRLPPLNPDVVRRADLVVR